MGAILLTFELNKSTRRSTESAEMLGVKYIAFINLFLTETDLQSVVTEINISKKILKWSNSSTSLITMDEMFRPLLMSRSRVCPWLCVGPYTCLIRSKVFKTVYTISYLKYSQGSDYFNGFLSTLLYQNYCIKTLIQSVNQFLTNVDFTRSNCLSRELWARTLCYLNERTGGLQTDASWYIVHCMLRSYFILTMICL